MRDRAAGSTPDYWRDHQRAFGFTIKKAKRGCNLEAACNAQTNEQQTSQPDFVQQYKSWENLMAERMSAAIGKLLKLLTRFR